MSLHCFSSATELAQAIRDRVITSVEVLDLFLAQYERHHGRVNAICTLDAEGARKQARLADEALARGENWGPLHGLPVSFKDSYKTAGIRTVCGFEPLKDHVPDSDAFVVTRIKSAGGIPFAKTNVPPLLGAFHTDNAVFGRTNNPWDLNRTPGASSGGSGAALAAGMSPLDMGSDMLGSIRLPSHFCGLTGLKPTQFRVSPTGHYPPLDGGFFAGNVLATRGPMARRIEDLLLSFPVIAQFDPRDPEGIPMPLEAYPVKPFSEYRVAWTDDFGGLPVTPETRAALEKTARALEAAGCRVEKASPAGADFPKIWEAVGAIYSGTIGQGMPDEARLGWLEASRAAAHTGHLEKGRFQGLHLDYGSWFRTMRVRLDWIMQLRAFLDQWDGWLVPTSCTPAFRHEEVEKNFVVGGRELPYFTAVASHISPFNFSGSPAVTLPAALSSEGLPICLQLVGQPWRDLPLLRLAQRVEEAIGGFPTAPGF
jgi:amidase